MFWAAGFWAGGLWGLWAGGLWAGVGTFRKAALAVGRARRAVMDSPLTAAEAGSASSGSSCALAPAFRRRAANS